MKNSILLISALLLFTMHIFAQNNSFPVQTKVAQGIIEGNYDTKTGIQKYFGIPYAKPPVGALRWKAPQPAEPWQGVLKTKKFGPRAVQRFVYSDMVFRSDGVNEDCLYLNVWTPAKRETKNLPVLVYYYGGGFVAGDGSEPRYDGESMAKKGIVAVTVNYRLNIFGFLAHPALSAASPQHCSGNYGLLDQVAALKWVAKNIEAFGGDPNKITIAGESAGSISVSVLMASPLSANFIAGAIGESGAAIPPTLPPVSLQDAEKIGKDFVENAGYKNFEEFRNLPTKDIYESYNKSGRFGFPMVIDNYLLPKTLPEIFNDRQQAQVPLLLGWNSSEIPGKAFMRGKPYTEESYLERVKQSFPNHWKEVLKQYPHSTQQEIELSATALASDGFIVYSTWKWFDLHRQNSDQPVYRYLYAKRRPPTPGRDLKDEPIGAPHACEIEYCMGNLPLIKAFEWTKDDYLVSQTMQNYFANFIKTGNPSGSGLVSWPAAKPKASAPPVMIINTKCKVENANTDSRYKLLDQIYQSK